MRALLFIALLLLPQPSEAQRVIHRVRFGETLASLSADYYGSPQHARVIAAANGISLQQELPAGDHLRIPTAWTYTVQRPQTVPQLAKTLLGDSRRWPALAAFNKLPRRKRLRKDIALVVPFTLAYQTNSGDTFAGLSERFLGEPIFAKLIASYNNLRGGSPPAGIELAIPIGTIRITPQRLEQLVNSRLLGVNDEPDRASREALQEANALLRGGDYWEVALRLVRLLAREIPSDAYLAEVFKLLAVAYVALDREEMAVKAFEEALLHQPSLNLDPVTTSPKVIRIFLDAKSKLQRGGS